MGRKLGYENYVQLGYYRMGRNCYTKGDVEKFRASVVKYLVPVAEKIFKNNLTGNNNAESEIMTWADGSKTKDYRYVLATGNSSDTYMTHIEYVVPSNSELLTRFGIRKITRNAIDYSCV